MRSGDTFLVTGGEGCLGSVVVDRLRTEQLADTVVVYDQNEPRPLVLRETGCGSTECRFEMGDIRDRERVRDAMCGVDYVIHAAAVKQVPNCERHPHEAVKTNVDGTRNVVQAAIDADVESVLTVSTDKAANPVSTMGATKLVAERVTLAADPGEDGPRVGCIRLGNVIGSSRSVVSVFREQLEDGGPITLTDREMTRFVMSKSQAAEWIIDRALKQAGGTIDTPDIGRFRVIDLAEMMIDEYAPPQYDPAEIDIDVIGKRPGERYHEYLVGPTEVDRTVERDGLFSIAPPGGPDLHSRGLGRPAALPEHGYRSDTEPYLDHRELRDLLESETASTDRPPQENDRIAVVDTDD